MRVSKLYAPTLKEVPNDAELISHQLLLRAGYIRKVTAGIYDYLPLARKVLHKIEKIIREELDAADAQELLMPMVQPAEIWKESGRWQKYGPELLRLKDRKGSEFCLGPTHEEVIVDLVRRDIRSWRDLPLNLYQIQAKFRDEIRPRAGLMRGREFIMKDAYSFDVDEQSALQSYDQMFDAYCRIFKRCGLEFRPVEADTGAIGGSRSHEFQVLADRGEDAIVSCTQCQYAANVEQAELLAPRKTVDLTSITTAPSKISTPNQKSIEEVSTFLKITPQQCIKTLALHSDLGFIVVLLRGDHELNDIKLKKHLGADFIEKASEEQIIEVFSTPPGYLGPYLLNTKKIDKIFIDYALQGSSGMVVGGNEIDTHYQEVCLAQHCPDLKEYVDLRMAQDGDACPRCEGSLKSFKGIEVGHVFYLGTRYSEAMRCTVLDKDGKECPMEMGCYGIGVSRVMAAAIEQNHDSNGICWPAAIAPYQVHILTLQPNKEDVVQCAEDLYQTFKDSGVEVLYDDRPGRAGAKFKDADLIGVPWRIAIGGRGLKEGVVEVKARASDSVEKILIDQVCDEIMQRINHKK